MTQTHDRRLPFEDPKSLRTRRLGCLAVFLLSPIVVLLAFLLLPLAGDGGPVQFTLVNRSGGPVRIDFLRLDDKLTAQDTLLQTYSETQDRQRGSDSAYWGFLRVRPRTFPIEVRYVDVSTGELHHGQFEADGSAYRVCWFFITLRADGPELSECHRSELLDFDSP